MDKFKSRKFLVTVAAVLGFALLAIAGQISATEAVNKILPIVVVYLGAQGYVDSKK